MDINKFKVFLYSHEKSQKDLETMLNNARRIGNAEYIDLAKKALDERFPSWNMPTTRRGGARPTIVKFRDESREFPSGKDAYRYLIEKFISVYPDVFNNIDWQTYYVGMGKKRLYFGQTLEKIFFGSPHLADEKNNYIKLSNGWYANVNLSNDQKFEILCKYAELAKLTFEDDWSWRVLP